MIFGLSRRTDLALKAIGVLSRAEIRMTGAALAGEIGTTLQFLPQVIAPLIRAGWVDSERGPRGGYRAQEALESIPLLELIEATEGEIDNGRCVLRDGPCPGSETCPVHIAWMSARDVLLEKLSELSIAQALSQEAPA